MSRIAENLERIKFELPKETALVVVSKFRSLPELQEAYQSGQRHFAENRVQALLERRDMLPADVKWHLIGHLQTNKVKHIAPFIHLIHSVDSFRLMQTIHEQAVKNNRIIDCLLQVFVAREETKYGMEEHELFTMLDNEKWQELKGIRICGLMAMATFTDNTSQIATEFSSAKRIFDAVKKRWFSESDAFTILSTGMSSDYKIAVQYGSTMVRIGSAVFEG